MTTIRIRGLGSDRLWTRTMFFFVLAVVLSSNCAFSQFVYVVNANNAVSGYSFDSHSGVLAAVPGSPFAAGAEPTGLAVDPTGRFVFIANAGSNNISAYAVESGTGTLRALPGGSFATGSRPVSLAIDRSGRFLYVANSESSDISAFAIGTASGALARVAGSPFSGPAGPAGIAIDPGNRFVYVAHTSGSVSAYSINPESGALIRLPGSPFAAGNNATGISIEPRGKFAYVTTDDGIWAFSIDSTSGALRVLPGSPYAVEGASGSLSIVVHPGGQFAYVSSGGRISAYALDGKTGALSAVSGAQFEGGMLQSGMVIDPSGKFMYQANDLTEAIAGYSVESGSGAVTRLASNTAASRARAIAILKKPEISAAVAGGTPLITSFSGNEARNNFSGGFGMLFTVGPDPLTVTALGRIYILGNTGSHLIRLVRASDFKDVPGGSVTVSLPSGEPGEFAYVPLPSPITLDANTSYYLLSQETEGGDVFYNLGSATSSAAVGIKGGVVDWPSFGFISVGGPNSTYVPANLLYLPPGSGPSILITAPANGATVSGTTVPVAANATAGAGLTIASVQFKLDNNNLGAALTASPFTLALDTTKLINGSHTLTAVATDSAGNGTTSAPVTITVANNPTVAITTPTSGATLAGDSVPVSATASAVSGLTITQVQFKLDNVNLGAPLTTAPYNIVLDTTKLTNAAHTLLAVATDSANNTATSAPVSFTVNNTKTTVEVTAPVPGANVAGNTTLTATATAGAGFTISQVQFKVDNAPFGAPILAGPFSVVLDTTTLANGSHTVVAVAADSASTTATSTPVTFNVSNGGPPPSGTALISAFTTGAPRNNFTGSFGMRFIVGGNPLNVTALGRIYVAGNNKSHVVRLVRASDGTDVPGGSVTITLPSGLAGQFVYAALPSPVTLDANTTYYLLSAETASGDQFYDLGPVTPTNAVSVVNGVVEWPDHGIVQVGPINNSFGPVNLLYTTAGAAPAVSISSPLSGATISGNNVTVSATASAGTGLTITGVQFKVDNVNQGAPDVSSPFSFILDATKLSNGPHTLTAVATDSASSSTTSAPVTVTVNNNPTVAVTAPASGATVTGNSVPLTATATAVAGLTIANVQFKVDNVNQGGPITAAPYTVVLDSTKLSNASHSVVAVATDSAGNTATSATLNFTVNNSPTTVVVTAPSAGSSVAGSTALTATATAGPGLTITSVQFKVDDKDQGAAVTTSPYSTVLDTTALPNGQHTVTAVVKDSAGNTVTSTPVNFTVSNAGPQPAGTPMVTAFTTGPPRNNFTASFGMQFTVGAKPLEVTALGRLHVAGNTGSHVVRLKTASDGKEVPGGSVTIVLPSGPAGQFVYAALPTPVVLNANTSYYLVSDELNGGDLFYDLGPVVTTSAVSVNSGIVDWTDHGIIPVGPANTSFVPVNLLYNVLQ